MQTIYTDVISAVICSQLRESTVDSMVSPRNINTPRLALGSKYIFSSKVSLS